MAVARRAMAVVVAMGLGLAATGPASWAADEKPATAKAEPIDFRKLKALLPEKLAGMKRSDANGQKVKTGDFSMSMATANYAKESDAEDAPHVDLTITDYSAAPGMAEGMASWSKIEIDSESDDGYQKTTKVQGHPAFETYEKEGKSGQLQVFVGGRYIVAVSTSNMTPEEMAKVGKELPLEKLAALK